MPWKLSSSLEGMPQIYVPNFQLHGSVKWLTSPGLLKCQIKYYWTNRKITSRQMDKSFPHIKTFINWIQLLSCFPLFLFPLLVSFLAVRFSLQEWVWMEKNRALSWICTVQRYKREKSKPTAPKHSQLKIQKIQLYVQALGGTNIQWHSNPDTQTPVQWRHRRDLPTCHCVTTLASPGLSAAGNKMWFLPVPFSQCPLLGSLKALPLEWHGTHKQFFSL